MTRADRSRLPLVAGCCLVVAIALGICSIIRWNDWNYGYDLGIFAQVVDNVPRGFVDQPEGGTHFRFHFAPLLAVLWPAMAIFRSPMVLEWAQLVLVIAAVPLVYVLFRRYAEPATCAWLALLALANPFLYSQAFNEFHELCFYPVPALALVWALDRQRWLLAVVFGLACFAVREDALLVTVVACASFALVALHARRRGGSRARGLLLGEPEDPRAVAIVAGALAVGGALIIAGYFSYARAYLGGWEPAAFYRYSFAASPAAVVLALITAPAQSWPALLTWGRAGYLAEALACTAFLALRSRWMMLAVPGLGIVLLANNAGVWRVGAHYALIWVPWLLLAFGDAAIRADGRARHRWFVACAVVLAAISLTGNPLHLGTYLKPSYHDLADAARALESVGNEPLSTHDEWQTRISVRDPMANSALAPGPRWLVYADDYPDAAYRRTILPAVRRMVQRGIVRAERRFGAVVVYRWLGSGSPRSEASISVTAGSAATSGYSGSARNRYARSSSLSPCSVLAMSRTSSVVPAGCGSTRAPRALSAATSFTQK